MDLLKNRKEMGKLAFESPRVLKRTQLEMEQSILSSSSGDSTQIETTGQEVVEYGAPSADAATFNHEWY